MKLVLFVLTLGLAVLLAGTVLLSPWLSSPEDQETLLARILNLMANDTTVRRTTLAGALGLLVTAWVFFRPDFLATSRK